MFRIEETGVFTAAVRFVNAILQNGAITDVMVADGAAVDASKLDHQHALVYHQPIGSDVITETVPIYTGRAAGEVIDVTVQCLTAPTGSNPTSDKDFTVDIKTAVEGSTTLTSILSAPVVIDVSRVNGEMMKAAIATAAYAAEKMIAVEITASGSTGTQGQGLVVVVTVREAAD